MDTWGAVPSLAPPTENDWTSYYESQAPSGGWWASEAVPYSYSQSYSSLGKGGLDYHPGGRGMMYEPESGFSYDIIAGEIDDWMAREFPELFDYTQGWTSGGVGNVGTVAPAPWLGQFHQTPGVDAEIQAAANKYGVPANFLKAIIAKESSGDWASNSMVKYHRGMRIHGYIGVYENAAAKWGFNFDQGIGNRAYQIEMLAGGLRRFYDMLHGQNPNYGWLNVAAFHYSGDASGATTPSDSYQHGTAAHYMAETESWWKRMDQEVGNTWSNFTDAGQQTGIGSIQNEKWAPVNRYDQMVSAAAMKYGVPANLIKAVMQFESGGDPTEVSKQGATGLMQVMPVHVGGDQASLFDPQTNIDVGTRILMENYRRWGSWELAAKAYLAGNPYSTAVDAYGTGVGAYWSRVNANWQELNAGGTGGFGAPPAGNGGSSIPIAGIWGGGATNISQEFGRTEWSQGAGRWMYDYSVGLGIGSGAHPGLDISMPVGTNLYSPASGTVIRSGGSGSFYNTPGTAHQSGTGELRIRLDNGHEVILGHMARITVPVGTRVTAGMPVGTSGYPAGPHLHLEYRIPDPSTSTGWRAVDPRQYITGGIIPGTHQSPYTGIGSPGRPLTYQNLLIAAARGETIPQGAFYSTGGGANSWNAELRRLMSGLVPTTTNYRFTYNLPEIATHPFTPGGSSE